MLRSPNAPASTAKLGVTPQETELAACMTASRCVSVGGGAVPRPSLGAHSRLTPRPASQALVLQAESVLASLYFWKPTCAAEVRRGGSYAPALHDGIAPSTPPA